ncbi:uncharacterized protein J7T54_006604 [Emericellopsis cladophorae]|uniref:Major facilitator superfamily (MFS) profile domain-containing protein n=1 Tax=Emericellopsis cladophorae TaxID=2686198 RepID=A0A9P9Y857_9HYPO|nr:uncharacterized protein J7T54_006604 [Emericellopsis cladophorae]KAI6784559.1 hypothetical protein J7T54_006604 [Emericellopsis cladophorae]
MAATSFPPTSLSAWNSIAPANEIVATFIFALLLERFGRKGGILAASLISVTSVLFHQLAPDWLMHLAGRGGNGIAIGMMFTISPLIVVGQFATVVVSQGSSHIDGLWQWWLPVVAMYTFPLILAAARPFFPKSPYWLVRRGRTLDAKKALRRIYGLQEAEYDDIEINRRQGRDSHHQRHARHLWSVVLQKAHALLHASHHWYSGCIPNQSRANWGIVALLYIWALIYKLSIGAAGLVLASEIATMRLRAATQGLITITNSLWGLIMQFAVPYMINPDAGNSGGKIGFIFLGVGLIASVGGWISLSRDTLDELYAMKVAPRHFKRAVEDTETGLSLVDPTRPLSSSLVKGGDVHLEHAV